MQIQPSDLADRYTILKIKKEMGLSVGNELEAYEKEIGFLDESILTKLYLVNKKMWITEAVITGTESNEDIGSLYRRLRNLTIKRSKIKNRITNDYGGFEELKRY